MKFVLRYTLIFSLFAAFSIASYSASVDTAAIYSNSMRKEIKCVIIKPDTYKNQQLRYPVVYLLHGYGDNYSAWIKKVPALKSYSDQMQLVIVCPDGGFSSWYFDSPVDPAFKYETYVGKEVVGYIDIHYRTFADRNHRAITGLSMGGHGALYLALRHSETFGLAGSISGGVDMRPFPGEWDIAKRIGDSREKPENWENMSIITMIGHYPAQPLAIMIECGTEDFFYTVNLQLHQKMLTLKIAHDYVERPGKHTWEYWRNAIEYHLLFFKNHFKTQKN